MHFSPLLKSTLLATLNLSPPTVFSPRRLKLASFCRKLSCRDRHIHFFNIQSLSVKNIPHKKNMQKMQFLEEKKNFICISNVCYSEIRKDSTWSCAPSHCKWNKIIKFVLSVKLWEKIRFLQDPQKTYIFLCNSFLYVSQKKSRNKLCLEPHDTYFLFRTFFSHVNIKWFFLSSDPLHDFNYFHWLYST